MSKKKNISKAASAERKPKSKAADKVREIKAKTTPPKDAPIKRKPRSKPKAKAVGRRRRRRSPLNEVLPYQSKWLTDDERFKIGLMARQTGKSWTTALEAVLDCKHRNTSWVCLSAGERQALEWMRKARYHAEMLGAVLDSEDESRDTKESLLKSAEIRWKNGSRLLAIPANPDTARGYSANLLLDEFAFHENPDAIWRAIYPSISNPLKEKFKIRIVSTPNGLGNKFADLWQKPNNWKKHHVDIYQAKEQGLPVDIEELRAGLDDPEGWAQEYECQFIDTATVLLPYELILPCENSLATTSINSEFWNTPTGGAPLYLGVDFGRKHDLTVCWTLELAGGVFRMTREVLELQNVSTPDQLAILRSRCRRARRVCFDYTGPGVGLGDLLVREFQEYNEDKHLFGRIELCNFTNHLKVNIFPKLRMAFEQKTLGIPINRAIREDLHSLNRVALAGGGVTYRAPHTTDGHADRCTALALAIRAASFNAGASPIHIFENTRRSTVLAATAERTVLG